MHQSETAAHRHRPPGRKRRHVWVMLRSALAMTAFLVLLVGGGLFGLLALTGKTLRLPDWAVDSLEQRLNAQLDGAASTTLEAVEVLVDDGWVPRLKITGIRLAGREGATLLTLPEARVVFSGTAFASGAIRPTSVRLSGGAINLRRDAQGRIDIDLGAGNAAELESFAALLDGIETVFATPVMSELALIDAQALSLTLTDARTGQAWRVRDGRLAIENRPDALAATLAMSLSGGATDGRADITFVTDKTDAAARISAIITGIEASDLAAQAAPLSFLQVLDAPLSGEVTAELGPDGMIASLDSALDIGAGALTPPAPIVPVAVPPVGAAIPDTALPPLGRTTPIPFDRARIALAYDPDRARIVISDLTMESQTARLTASGHLLPVDANGKVMTADLQGRLPAAFLTQIAFSDVRIDPAGLFETPVTFAAGALDARLTLDPFRIDLGQLSLVDGARRVLMTGQATAGSSGWTVGLNVALNDIAADRLVALWPVRLVPKTRAWLAANVQQGNLFDVKGAVRLAPGAEPQVSLSYEFTETQVRFIRTLPPIEGGSGYSTLEGRTYTIVLDSGTVTPPEGGPIDVAGSVFAIPDITQRPNRAEIDLATRSSLTATLSLLDQPPFGFMTKADRPVALGDGQALMRTRLSVPLVQRAQLAEIDYTVAGEITGFRSELLVPGRVIAADALTLAANPRGLEITGPGRLGAVPFDVTYAQGFGPDARGRARIEGVVTLSDAATDDLGLGLPDGMLSGEGTGQVAIDLVRGEAPRLTLTSTLAGIGLALPDIGWSKAPGGRGTLEVEATLGRPAAVTRIALDAAGLRATGDITLRSGGGLDRARFDRVTLDDWLDVGVTLTGQGRGRATIAVTSGSIDLRRMPDRGAGGRRDDGSPFTLALDQLIVTDAIAFTGFRGEFTPRGGLNGSFTAAVNGEGAVQGTVVPVAAGSAVRIRSDDAGTVMAKAGVFSAARGGSLDLQLIPRAGDGIYDGRAEITDVRVRNANVLAELLNAVSVVGLLEQLNGQGIVFSNAEVDFLLTPEAIEISKGSAVGASLGVSMAGVYQTGSKRLDVQGVISPIYLVNGVGAVLTRRGEGLFGFNYRLRGTSDDPAITVNPLSILTPGMFRDIFRRPAPVLGREGIADGPDAPPVADPPPTRPPTPAERPEGDG
jgi:hypothetical protein